MLMTWPRGYFFPSIRAAAIATRETLMILEQWSENRCLSLNPSKCKAFSLVDPLQANLQSCLSSLNPTLSFNSTPTVWGSSLTTFIPFPAKEF